MLKSERRAIRLKDEERKKMRKRIREGALIKSKAKSKIKSRR